MPLLRIEGRFRPFRLSPRKAKAILEVLEDIKKFVEDTQDLDPVYGKKAERRPLSPEELAIIAKYVKEPWPEPLTAEPK